MRTVLAALFICGLLVSFAAGMRVVKADSTDCIHFSSGVTIFSPLNRTYNSKFLTLNFSLACGWGMKYSLKYNIDGKYDGSMPYEIKNPEELHVVYYATGLVKLPELSEGAHNLTVYLETGVNSNHIRPLYVDTVNFALDLTPPNISILSPVNKTYTATNITIADIPLDFTVSEKVSQVAFSLDGQNDTVIAGNTTLTRLSIGPHNVTVYAWDMAGKTGASETVDFTVAAEPEPQAEAEPFPTVPAIAASVATVVFVSVGLVVNFKKKNHEE